MVDAHTETLRWLFKPGTEGPGLLEWLEGGEGIYWIQGKPGSGKSTAMRYLFGNPKTLASLEGHDTNCRGSWIVIGSFFHDRGTQLQRSLDGILHSMLWQIMNHFPSLVESILKIKHLQTPHAKSDNGSSVANYSWTTVNLKRALFCVLKQRLPGKVCFMVDALDEFEGNDTEMVVFLEKLVVERHPANMVKICAASRPYNSFKDGFHGRPTLDMKEWTREDIVRYVNSRLRNQNCVTIILNNESNNITSRVQSQLDSLVKQIIDRASGVFIWVRLVVEQLLEDLTAGVNVGDLQRHLERIPDDLNEFYRYLFTTKVPRGDRFEAYVMLESVFCAMEPLSLAQLDMIVRLVLGRLSIKDDHPRTSEWVQSTAPNMDRRIVHCCRGLLEVQDGKVQMLHQTVKEYFSKSDAFEPLLGAGNDAEILVPTTYYNSFLLTQRPHAGHIFVLQLCLHCVQYPPRTMSLLSPRPSGNERYWYDWINIGLQIQFMYHAPKISPIDTFSMALLDDIDLYMRSHIPIDGRGWLMTPSELLHFAIYKDMKPYVKAKLEDDPMRAKEEPLLHFAIYGMLQESSPVSNRGNDFEMFDLLLSKGVSVTRSLPWTFPLGQLGDLTRPEGPTHLISSGTCYDTTQCTPTQCIFHHPQKRPIAQSQAVDYLVLHGADPDSIVYYNEKGRFLPLLHAVVLMELESSIKWALVEKLCDHGANITATSDLGFTFLEFVKEHFPDISAAAFKSLLVRGAKITSRMLASPKKFDNFTWRDMDKKEWYEGSAQLTAETYHPEWSFSLFCFEFE
ncbi:hypothetical protein MMC17_000394 [Xylographa soralifera]|nr:hypothetical protein [Xylographa soralifera]